MRELAQWRFEVVPGERIDVRVAASDTDVTLLRASLDGLTLPPLSGPYFTYSFTALRTPGQAHVLMLLFDFPPDTPPAARYDLSLKGSDTSHEFSQSFHKIDGSQSIAIEFTVASATHTGGPILVQEEGQRVEYGEESQRRRDEERRAQQVRDRQEADRRYAEQQHSREDPTAATRLELKPANERLVNVGFSPQAQAATRLTPDIPLACSQEYYLWMEIGDLIPESLEVEKPTTLPTEYLPLEARLKVVLFAFKDEIEILNTEAVGELKQEADGSIVVTRQPVQQPRGVDKDPSLLTRRLFFPVRTPRKPGVYRLRCNIYYEQVLVQSRLISAVVVRRPRSLEKGVYPTVEDIVSRLLRRPRRSKNALISTVDYTLSQTISPSHLASIESHQLSLMLNSNGNGTMELRFFGQKGFIRNAAFDEQELQDLINQARGALRRTAWGDEETWKEGKTYKYEVRGNPKQLESDLIMLAKKGYSFYDKIIERFETKEEEDDYKVLAALMREPARLQIALKASARHIIPAALIYDYPLDNGLNDRDYKICPAFQKALSSASPLEEADCFNGRCPTKEASDVICPSGFWGYRHYLGMPLTLAEAPDAPTRIQWEGSPHLTMAVSTDLELREIHEKALRTLGRGLRWDYADTRDKTIQLLKETKPHLVYFYCHGGLDHNEPYIEVGPAKGPVIKEATFRTEGIKWNDPRPLVFINGCHTTALEPKQAMEFAGAFVKKANAAGVIGTEITVFESLAHTFAENFLRRFIVDSKPLGESVRNARLDLLKLGNPLGLAYVPFVIASICMLEQQVVS